MNEKVGILDVLVDCISFVVVEVLEIVTVESKVINKIRLRKIKVNRTFLNDLVFNFSGDEVRMLEVTVIISGRMVILINYTSLVLVKRVVILVDTINKRKDYLEKDTS